MIRFILPGGAEPRPHQLHLFFALMALPASCISCYRLCSSSQQSMARTVQRASSASCGLATSNA